jgi:hypothetical protein
MSPGQNIPFYLTIWMDSSRRHKMTGKNNSATKTSTTRMHNTTNPSRKIEPQIRLYKIVSLGAILSGVLACLASVGVGMSLMLAGTMILAEL